MSNLQNLSTSISVGDGGARAEAVVNALLQGSAPFLVTRTGNVEARAIAGGGATRELRYSAGWYCRDAAAEADVFQDWATRYVAALRHSNLVMIVPSQRNDCQPLLDSVRLAPDVCVDTMQLAALVRFLAEISRTKKRVLVINSKVELMKSQAAKFSDLFPDSGISAAFPERLTYLKSSDTYPGHEPGASWSETFQQLCNSVDQIDFDLALLGCGCYGLPLCDHIFSMRRRSAFYVGGFIQLLFGILGKRWLSREREKAFFNDHWIRVPAEMVPTNAEHFEGGAYW